MPRCPLPSPGKVTNVPQRKFLRARHCFCLPGPFCACKWLSRQATAGTFRHHVHARLGSRSRLGATITQHLRQNWLGALHSSAVNQGNSSPPINIDMSLARPQRAGSPPAFAAASWRTKPRTSSPMCPPSSRPTAACLHRLAATSSRYMSLNPRKQRASNPCLSLYFVTHQGSATHVHHRTSPCVLIPYAKDDMSRKRTMITLRLLQWFDCCDCVALVSPLSDLPQCVVRSIWTGRRCTHRNKNALDTVQHCENFNNQK